MNIQSDDIIYNEVARQGYLPESAIQHFRSAHVFQELNLKGTMKMAPDDIRPYHDYFLRLQNGNQLLGYGVLLQSDAGLEYQVYLFQQMCRLICVKMKKEQQQSDAADYLLRDILNQSVTDPMVIQERVKYIELQYEGTFVLLLLTFMDSNNIPGSYAVNTISSLLPLAKVFQYEDTILALVPLKSLEEVKFRHQLQAVKDRLALELKKQKMKAIASRSFRLIPDIVIAYEQCRIGLMLGQVDDAFVFYEDYWLQHMFYLCTQEIPLSSFSEPVIWEIAAQKENSAVPSLDILRVYLENDRNLTQCAEKLHMHRNNVIYHIKKLEERYNLNLEDSDQRLRLLISLKIHSYLLSNPHG